MTYPKGFIPFLGEFGPSSDSFMPDYRKVGDTSKVLCDSYTVVKVDHHMPPPSWHKHSLSWTLNNLHLYKWTQITRMSKTRETLIMYTKQQHSYMTNQISDRRILFLANVIVLSVISPERGTTLLHKYGSLWFGFMLTKNIP